MPKNRILFVFIAVAVIATALTTVDLIREAGPFDLADVLINFADELLLLGAMAAVAWTMRRVDDLADNQEALANNIARTIAQGEVWRAQRKTEIEALGRAIEDQFKVWRLTTAEIDIAGLMLKGASLKEIALARDTSEATIRQQAQAVYRKSGLSGRAELSAYFLESLFAVAETSAERRPDLALVSATPHT
jgi:DNA-binding NarL/FixJ family response regulator